jgi:hypothetical protein
MSAHTRAARCEPTRTHIFDNAASSLVSATRSPASAMLRTDGFQIIIPKKLRLRSSGFPGPP